MAVVGLQLDEFFEQLFAVVLLAGVEGGRSGQGDDVGIVRFFGRLDGVRDFRLDILLARLAQRPGDVGVGHFGRGLAETVERLGVPLVSALAVAAGEEPIGGPLEHRVIDRIDLLHVAELHQPVGGQGFVAGVAAEPLVAFLLALVAGELLCSPFATVPSSGA